MSFVPDTVIKFLNPAISSVLAGFAVTGMADDTKALPILSKTKCFYLFS
jgi:hypothetical protein